ncbi:protein kilB [Streptomyces sp. NPDC001890]|uniref:protein kilB n=1 Tax=Streptomyces sp. NPDC001890 TaxID=3364620 RepID=UPI003696A225
MLSTVIAVVGTLLGAVVAGLIQHRTARTARSEARDDHRRDRELEAVTAFASAVAGHRRAMAVREELRLSGADLDAVAAFASAVAGHRRAMAVREGLRLDGADPETLTAARVESHTTRAAIEAPKVQVLILVPSLAAAAEEATRATFALRNAPDRLTLDALREDAVKATDQFVAAAARYFA